jgi:hypothetical protein
MLKYAHANSKDKKLAYQPINAKNPSISAKKSVKTPYISC